MNKKLVKSLFAGTAMVAVIGAALAHDLDSDIAKRGLIERGRHLVATSGCNDCHTPGYGESGGMLPTTEWLTGSPVGFKGPWGVTYPANLRLELREMSEELWIAEARTPRRPPMPWFSLRDMSDRDLRAIYWFIRSLGPRGEEAPAYVPPNGTVTTPYIDFVPKLP